MSTANKPPEVDQLAAELSTLGHPARLRLLHAFCRAEEIVLSPSEAAALIADFPLGVLSYHVRRMREAGLLISVKDEPRRGAIEHYYAATARARELAAMLRLDG